MADNEIELYDVYSETGFQGARERTVSYRLVVGKGNQLAKATLVVETDVRSFPDNGDASQTSERYEIQVEDLVKLIKERGRRI